MDKLSTESSKLKSSGMLPQPSKIEQDMHKLMTKQVKLAITQVILAILGLVVGCIIATIE